MTQLFIIPGPLLRLLHADLPLPFGFLRDGPDRNLDLHFDRHQRNPRRLLLDGHLRHHRPERSGTNAIKQFLNMTDVRH